MDNLEINQNNQKKAIPTYDAKNFDYTQVGITFKPITPQPPKIDEKFEEREDDPQEFQDEPDNQKNEEIGLEEDDLIYLKDNKKLEVL